MTTPKRKQGGEPRRQQHKGWVMTSLVVDQVIKIAPNNFTREKITQKGWPLEFYWPTYEDYEGARALIDVVIKFDVAGIARLNAQHPLFDFQLGDWLASLEAEKEAQAHINTRVLKTTALARGFVLEHVLEENTTTRTQSIQQRITQNGAVVASKTIAKRELLGV